MRQSVRRLWQVMGLCVELLLTHPFRWQSTVRRWRERNDLDY